MRWRSLVSISVATIFAALKVCAQALEGPKPQRHDRFEVYAGNRAADRRADPGRARWGAAHPIDLWVKVQEARADADQNVTPFERYFGNWAS